MSSIKSPLLPNILITGTPGCGKTSTSIRLCELLPSFTHIQLGELIKSKSLHDGYDEEFDTHILNEDKVVDELESLMQQKGKVIDFHSCDFFPERWFDLVIVLRADNSVLYERLEARGYNQKKTKENVEAEIMQVCLDEAKDSYAEEIVVELQSNTTEELETNVLRIVQWVENWQKDHAK